MNRVAALDWIEPDWAAPPGVRALVTTRRGGASQGRFASLNLATHVGDDPAAVARNRARLRSHLPAEPVWLEQAHGAAAVVADAVPPGTRADAAVTRVPGTVCAVLSADCLPVLLADRGGRAVGIAHAGWRGLAAGVIEAAVARIGVPPAALVAWLGPAIGPHVYEVGAEVRAVLVAADAGAAAALVERPGGKFLADLYALGRRRLAAAGVTEVAGGGFCTFTERDRFFSYRRDGTTGRFASLIWMDR